ncbi:hypothetical protein EST38_g3106 [Candolleomyces aberdarensis]|uniref:Uncharacterized protein n=1 Tax=Candolleomyces aberdarensis TaxID=2316362 RepID=A0A4Q2DT11_9AGAR|nr:hypothetical protein EST38_g3106 [Candolleomyces aberdarensis]
MASQPVQTTTRVPATAVVVNVMNFEPILAPRAKDAKDQLQANVRRGPEEKNSQFRVEYQRSVDGIRRLAKEQFQEKFEREHQEHQEPKCDVGRPPLVTGHRKDGSAGMWSIKSTPPAPTSVRRSSKKHASPTLADKQEYNEEMDDMTYKSTPASRDADATGPVPRSDSSDFERSRAKRRKFKKKNRPTNSTLDWEQVEYSPPPRIDENGVYPIDPTSTLEQPKMVHPLPTGGVRGQVTSIRPPKIRGPRERLLSSVKWGNGQKERVTQQRDTQKQHEHELERGREKEGEKEQESQGEEVELEARERGEQERKNRETKKILHELEGAGGKAEDAPKLAQEAESKRLAEGQAEEPIHQKEEADEIERQAQREAERQHNEALESQQPGRQVDKQSPKEMAQIERKERDRAMQAVPIHGLTKQWKATLKSRIDQEIGMFVQLNTQWFEEQLSKAEEDDKPHFQNELDNIQHSLDMLRNLSLEMLGGDMTEMVVLVDRGSADVDNAESDKGEDGEEDVAAYVHLPGPREDPPAIEPGQRQEEVPPEVVDAEEPAKEDKGKEEAMQLDKLKHVLMPRLKTKRRGVSSFANAHHFVIHQATFINSETANLTTSANGT